MKIRTDFVTNSSSSSFIFGNINGKPTLHKNELLSKIEKRANGLIHVIEYITKELNKLDKKCYMLIESARHFELKYWDLIENSETQAVELTQEDVEIYNNYHKIFNLENKVEIKSFALIHKVNNIKEKIKQREQYHLVVNEAFEKYNTILTEYFKDLDSFKSELDNFYITGSGLKELYTIKSYINNLLTDFKSNEPVDGYDIEELLEWYNFESTEAVKDKTSEAYKVYMTITGYVDLCQECDKLNTCNIEANIDKCEDKHNKKVEELRKRGAINYNKAALQCLGEYGIYGLWEEDLPNIIVLILSKEARLWSNHMG